MVLIMILGMTLAGSVASLFLKQASGSLGIWNLLRNKCLYVGGFLYLAGAILNIMLLQRFDYSVVLPLTSLTYVWTMILSRLFLKEPVTKCKAYGVALIFIGAIVISL